VEKAYEFRAYPKKEQCVLAQKTFGCVRFVYNHYLNAKIESYKKVGKSLSYNECSKDMTALKKTLPWLNEVDSTALQSSLKNLDNAFSMFFDGIKHGRKVGFPKFKTKHRSRKSFTSKMGIKVFDNAVRLPKLGIVPCVISRPVEGRPISITLKQSASGKYFVSILCTDIKEAPLQQAGKMVGIDLGIKTLVTTSDGIEYPNHKHLQMAQRKLARAQRSLSRKQKGSNNRAKARIQVARQHENIKNRREDTLHKLTTELVREYDLIAVESLRVRNMVKNHRLAKAISDASWSELIRMLQYKAKWYGKMVIEVDSFFPSSQLCHCCGHRNHDTKNLNIRKWTCPICGAVHDRDVNAAINILNEGVRILTQPSTAGLAGI